MILRSDRGWRKRGSGVVLKTMLLEELLAQDDVAVVSLREAISWATSPPSALPPTLGGGACGTVIIGGLDPILEILPKADAEGFLRNKIRDIIRVMQDVWPDVGLVFGVNSGPESVKVDFEDHVLFKRGDERLQLSASLWNGSAGRDLAELKVTDPARQKDIAEGYYVPRLS